MTSAEGTPAAGGGGLLGVLQEPTQNGSYEKDIRLIARAVHEEWPMSEEVRGELVNRLMKVVRRESVAIPCGEGGTFDSEAVADRNAVAAASVLKAMHEGNRSTLVKAAEFGQSERKILADASRPQNPAVVRILIVNERGAERSVNLREFYDGTVIDGGGAGSSPVLDPAAAPVPLPTADAARPGPEQGR